MDRKVDFSAAELAQGMDLTPAELSRCLGAAGIRPQYRRDGNELLMAIDPAKLPDLDAQVAAFKAGRRGVKASKSAAVFARRKRVPVAAKPDGMTAQERRILARAKEHWFATPTPSIFNK